MGRGGLNSGKGVVELGVCMLINRLNWLKGHSRVGLEERVDIPLI